MSVDLESYVDRIVAEILEAKSEMSRYRYCEANPEQVRETERFYTKANVEARRIAYRERQHQLKAEYRDFIKAVTRQRRVDGKAAALATAVI